MTPALLDALGVELGPFTNKPTSLSGQLESVLSVWASADGKTEAGIWECTDGTFTASRDGYHEICQILSGWVTVTETGGEPQDFHAGDTLVTPSGWTGTWEVHERVRKLFVIVTV